VKKQTKTPHILFTGSDRKRAKLFGIANPKHLQSIV
jgi:hypothetical protein